MESEALVEFGKPLKRLKTDTPTPQRKRGFNKSNIWWRMSFRCSYS